MNDWTKNERKKEDQRVLSRREADKRMERFNAEHGFKPNPNGKPGPDLLGKWRTILNSAFVILLLAIIASMFFNYTPFSNGLSLMLVLVVMYSLIYIIANAVIYNHVLAQ
jgi:hypothetical protein